MMIRRRAALLVPGSAISAAKSCLRLCSTSPLFSPSPPTPPRLFEKTPMLLMELRGENTALVRKVYTWMKSPLFHVPISPDRTLIYRGEGEKLPLCFDQGPVDSKLAVSPVLQIFSISVHANFEDQQPCNIYGSITANDGNGSTFDLYDVVASETPTSKDRDLLIGPGGGAIPRYVDNPTTLNFSLMDKTRQLEVVNGSLILAPKSQDFEQSCDKLLRGSIHDRHGYANVYYATFRFAVFAFVKVAIFESHRPFNELHGRIVARYCNSKRYCSSEDDLKYLESSLFNRSSERSVRMEVGNFIPLSRYVVAVPVCSSLVIDVDLWDSEAQFAKFSSEFVINDSGQLSKLMEIEGKGSILVDVVWRDPYTELLDRSRRKGINGVTVNNNIEEKNCKIEEKNYKIEEQKFKIEEKNYKIEEEKFKNKTEEKNTKTEEKIKLNYSPKAEAVAEYYKRGFSSVAGNNDAHGNIKMQDELMLDDQQFLWVLSPWSPRKTWSTVSKMGRCLAEVFSVYVCGTTHKVSSLCGTVDVGYGTSSFYLYERPRNNPEKLMPGRSIIPVGTSSAITSTCAYLEFDLKDADLDLEISKGCLYQNQRFKFWCNQNLCFVIRGAHGYAAVHYAFFDHAVQATLELTFSFNDSHPDPGRVNVYGCLLARYSTHNYSTSYEKKYYQSRLFDKPQSESVQLSQFCAIPLLKSAVAVPSDSSLIIEADLRVNCVGKPEAHIRDIKTFEIDLADSVSNKFHGENYCIQVKVKFDDAALLV